MRGVSVSDDPRQTAAYAAFGDTERVHRRRFFFLSFWKKQRKKKLGKKKEMKNDFPRGTQTKNNALNMVAPGVKGAPYGRVLRIPLLSSLHP